MRSGKPIAILLSLAAAVACSLCRTVLAEERESPQVMIAAADPNNLPFSNDREEGFENKIARIIASELGAELRYVWHAQRRGFLTDTLGDRKCDFVLGVPAGITQCLATQPYYRSSYVFVSRGEDAPIDSLADPTLAGMKIGVQLTGDGQLTPPANVLINRGLAKNIVPFSLYSDFRIENPPAQIIRAVASREIDCAVVWGPLAGYFGARETPPLSVSLIDPSSSPPELPLAFDMCLGVRQGNETVRDQLNGALAARQHEIEKVLDEYHVPRLQKSPQTRLRPR
jgi:mxaJ protein